LCRNCYLIVFLPVNNPKLMRLKKQISYPLLWIIITITAITFSCRKDRVIDNNPSLKLSFSNDTVIFDTVFTSLGSATQRLMVYNTSGSAVNITNILLAGGDKSPYRINVNGLSGSGFSDIELNGGDSLYIFARVTIDPTDFNNPYVVEDSILFLTNGNEQKVKLVAWGQNANYILADKFIEGFPPFQIVADSLETVHWTNEKPYVVYGYAVIDSYGKLIIDEGTRVYFHNNSGLWAYADGVLKVYGSPENPVTFQGDRLESFYDDLPGQWDRIWLMEGRQGEDHEIYNAIIKNGFIGIQAESFLRTTENKILLKNVIIENMTGIGIFSRFFNIDGANTVVANCGGYCLAFTGGGNYDFKQSTIANYWSYSVRNTPAVFINNYLPDTNDQPVPFPLNFSLGNSIIYGFNQNEFETDMVNGADSVYFLTHCLLKTVYPVSNPDNYNNILKNKDPKFLDYQVNDYRIDTLSPAIDYGDPAIAATVPYDILGNPRTEHYDLGAYQFVPGQDEGDDGGNF